MCEDTDYESLPTTSLSLNMIAGALAGITEHTVTYPLDVLKTRTQFFANSTTLYDNLAKSFARIYSTEGMASLWRGVNSVILGSGPAHALYFGAYEFCKEKFKSIDASEHHHISHASAGAIATLAHDGFLTPFDVIKQRMQISSQYRGLVHCASEVYRMEGFRAFYISYPTTIVMSVPFQAIQFTTYEYTRKLMNPSNQYNPLSHCVAGGLAGGMASLVTNPLDVAKTLLQTKGLSTDVKLQNVNGLVDAFKLIYQQQGLIGFTRGVQARMLSNIPSTAVAWTTYEFLKMVLHKSSIPVPNNLEA
ncbi:mitochondrial solute transporter [Globomyces pollinis-pini]|nr:mitochondrial solute transporter [Globomyces pollinis-pini]KAJ3000833.1 Fe(2+) transporter [Globomyces sp. JEL0801]KAJ3000855.1 Fe(2+) transporter [Globomyces sp. JEL0801]